MGNSATHYAGRAKFTTGAVILSNGAVSTYQIPLTAAELMLEHPQEMVVEIYPDFVNRQKKPTPLPADQNLEAKKLYAMIPIRQGKPTTLSYQQLHKLLTKTSPLLKSKKVCSYTGFLPLLARTCSAAAAPEEERNGAVLVVDDKGSKSDYFTEIFYGRPELLNRQIYVQVWKPSLDPIREKTVEAKVRRHWMF